MGAYKIELLPNYPLANKHFKNPFLASLRISSPLVAKVSPTVPPVCTPADLSVLPNCSIETLKLTVQFFSGGRIFGVFSVSV